MPLWAQGEAREGETESEANVKASFAGRKRALQAGIKNSSPSKESMGKTSGLTFQLPCQLFYHGFGDALSNFRPGRPAIEINLDRLPVDFCRLTSYISYHSQRKRIQDNVWKYRLS
jgi:hypothetical protein